VFCSCDFLIVSPFRYFYVTMLHADTFTTPNVLRSDFTLTTEMKPQNWRTRYRKDFHLHAPFTGAFVWRIEHKSLCNLLFADAVRSHIIESVCQGGITGLALYLILILLLTPFQNVRDFSFFLSKPLTFRSGVYILLFLIHGIILQRNFLSRY
jgi:uncharacterized integral membrane protein